MSHVHLAELPPWEGLAITAAGSVSLFATYWDDAWHTDLGRDSALIPPHAMLYGGVAVAGLVVVAWGLRALIRTRSLIAVLRHPPLLLAGLGGAFTLAAAPLDAAWHAAYGRDSVLWSPPHMLEVFASTTMAIGVLSGLRPAASRIAETAVSGLVLGSLTLAVLEYDTDVPQFSEVLYLPMLLAVGLYSAALTRRLIARRYVVTAMIAAYTLTRLCITLVLLALDRSAPDLPLALVGLAVMDLPWRSDLLRYAAAAAGTAAMAWIAAGLGLAGQPAGSIGMTAIPVIVAFIVLIALYYRPGRPIGALAALLVAVGVIIDFASPARAHDPGQGLPITRARLTAIGDGTGLARLTVEPASHCTELVPRHVIARRAGDTVAGALAATGDCRYSGMLRLPRTGRWFLYAEFTFGSERSGQRVETWLSLPTDRAVTTNAQRDIYRPAGGSAVTSTQLVAGLVLYGTGLSLLSLAVVLSRRRPVSG
jgi:hypothetical protein